MTEEVKDIRSYISDIKNESGIANLITVEHRSNNSKRDYLFVNRCQCKHIPCNPRMLYKMCTELASKVYQATKDNKVLVIGFAETATAIANILADKLPNGVFYMQTTREDVDYDKLKFQIGFSEEHSHAPTQYLLSDKTVEEINATGFDYVLFIDDEITTGKTIINCVNQFDYYFPDKSYGAASICNWQSDKDIEDFYNNGIERFYLLSGKINDTNRKMDIQPEDFTDDCTVPSISEYEPFQAKGKFDCIQVQLRYYKDERLSRYLRGINPESSTAREATALFITNLAKYKFGLPTNNKRVLILGTEEFMSIPCMVAGQLDCIGYNIKVQATTRSPISVIKNSSNRVREICNKAKIVGAYDKNRPTYLYNLDYYDKILVITDGAPFDIFYGGVLKSFGSFGVKPENVMFVELLRKREVTK